MNTARLEPVRLAPEELKRSRQGTLGCFPLAELYDPEEDDEQKQRRDKIVHRRESKE